MGRRCQYAGGDRRGVSAGGGDSERRPATVVAQAGRRPEWTHGIVNPPVYRASTCLFETLADLDRAIADPDAGLYYGRRGTPTQWALEAALTELEPGAAGTKLYPSGVAAISAALLSVLKTGDHLLMVDSVYEPTRLFCSRTLRDLGIETSYYDPTIGAGIADLIQPNTRAIFMESPGSLTFEVQDVPAIVAAAKARGIVTLIDNTWATPLLFAAIGHGVDLSVQSLTKFVVGHSDVLMGSVTAAPGVWERLRTTSYRLGQTVSADDAYLTLRGLRTLHARMERHGRSALEVARWLEAQPSVAQVLHPGLHTHPGHAIWQRDFHGASSLFAMILREGGRPETGPLVDGLKHFGMGFSFGGYESLILPVEPHTIRTATRWAADGPLVRLHIGLEDPGDLIADLEAGLLRYETALG
ncbi:cystathionine beta-lyase [Sphingoaurantiacus capsulatus]|uniref:Cystathionine beta-lyase n=1 Tax=Sphingoaurantiacus capsulatus TaxID=1771310 RepID=A0ABV7XD35_9SPHN